MPTPDVKPQSKAETIRDTVLGFTFVLFGLGAMGWYIRHNGHGHEMDRWILAGGGVTAIFGAFIMNKKRVTEFVKLAGEVVMFWRNKGGDDAES